MPARWAFAVAWQSDIADFTMAFFLRNAERSHARDGEALGPEADEGYASRPNEIVDREDIPLPESGYRKEEKCLNQLKNPKCCRR
jgi:hypothetical protein